MLATMTRAAETITLAELFRPDEGDAPVQRRKLCRAKVALAAMAAAKYGSRPPEISD
jgi:hypothetical protein